MEPDNHAVEPLDFAFAVSVIPIVLTDSLEASMALHDLYHGARANKLLFNIRNGSITADSSGKIYFAEREWQNRSEEHTSELQSLRQLVCRPLLEKKN